MLEENEKKSDPDNVLDEKTAKAEIKKWLDSVDFEGFDFDEEDRLKDLADKDAEVDEDKEFEELQAGKKKEQESKKPDHTKSFYGILLKYAMTGVLTFNDDGTVVHKLIKPIVKKSGEVYLDKMTYDCDIEYGKFKTKVNEIDKDDESMDSRLFALVSAVTGVGLGVLYKLRMRDASISRAIALFIG